MGHLKLRIRQIPTITTVWRIYQETLSTECKIFIKSIFKCTRVNVIRNSCWTWHWNDFLDYVHDKFFVWGTSDLFNFIITPNKDDYHWKKLFKTRNGFLAASHSISSPPSTKIEFLSGRWKNYAQLLKRTRLSAEVLISNKL